MFPSLSVTQKEGRKKILYKWLIFYELRTTEDEDLSSIHLRFHWHNRKYYQQSMSTTFRDCLRLYTRHVTNWSLLYGHPFDWVKKTSCLLKFYELKSMKPILYSFDNKKINNNKRVISTVRLIRKFPKNYWSFFWLPSKIQSSNVSFVTFSFWVCSIGVKVLR